MYSLLNYADLSSESYGEFCAIEYVTWKTVLDEQNLGEWRKHDFEHERWHQSLGP